MTRFLHITDLHLTAPETDDPHQHADTLAALERMIDIANTLSPRPDFVVASGDLTNLGDAASYRLLAQRMTRLQMPVLYALGNHDRREGFFGAFADHAGAPAGPLDHDAVHAGLHVVVLDSSVPGRVGGALDDDQMAGAAAMLARHPDLPKLVVVHHPPRLDPTSPYAWETLGETDSARLAGLLAPHRVMAVLSGHIHTNRVTLWHGIPVVTNIGQQSGVDLTRSRGMSVVEGSGFGLCDLLPSGVQVTFVPLPEPQVLKEIPEARLRGFS